MVSLSPPIVLKLTLTILIRNPMAIDLSVVKLFQLTLSESQRNKIARRYWKFINKFTQLGYRLPLRKINHGGRCLRSFLPSCATDNREITAKLQLPIQPLGFLVLNLRLKNPTTLTEIALYIINIDKHL